tara:strand:+ start:115 stop:435 length:321 start_codon:yes stop_codon:yes gene_type:complete
MRKNRLRHLTLTSFLFFTSIPKCYSQRGLPFYTTIEVLREKKYDYHQKKRWVMRNILSLDENENENENSKSHVIKQNLLEKKFSIYQEDQKKRRELQLKRWEEVLK